MWELYNYYFTFGSAPYFPYQRGQYVVVKARNLGEAKRKYKEKHPNRLPNTLNCACCYTEEVFNTFRDKYYKDVEPAEVIE